MEQLKKMIEGQRKGHKDDPIYMIGEQLIEIGEREPASRELLKKDLEVKGMGLAAVAEHFGEYADKNRKNAKCFCITPLVAEGLIRKFYGLPDKPEKQEPPAVKHETPASPSSPELSSETAPGFIDLSSFL